MDIGPLWSALWTPDMAALLERVPGLLTIALLGTGMCLAIWLRLVLWQRFSTLLVQTALTHAVVLWPVAMLSGLDFLQLLAWSGSIFAACYIGFCSYRASIRMNCLANLAPFYYRSMSPAGKGFKFLTCFFECAVYRATHSWVDLVSGPRTR